MSAKYPSTSKLASQAAKLSEAAKLVEHRLDEELIAQAQQAADRVDARLAFSGDDTVVALGGATGSGKSSLFNAISGTNLAEAGVKRPTTNNSMVGYWGDQLPTGLLDWLDVPRRHLVRGDSASLNGLALIDMPDHDSITESHRLEVDRLVGLVDMLIWVVDPQKYADAALHHNYLKPMADYAEVMMVVLNQADKLTEAQLAQALGDLRQLLDSEGLAKTQIMAVSALTGQGIDELRKTITQVVKQKSAAAQRFAATIREAAESMAKAIGSAKVPEKLPESAVDQLNRSLVSAAGVETVAAAVEASLVHRGRLATGWPVTKWLNRFRPDPLRALHLDSSYGLKKKDPPALEPVRVQRTSLPGPSQVQTARVDSALRAIAEQASAGLPDEWSDQVREVTLSNRSLLPDELDKSIATADLAVDRDHGWWNVVRVVQWIIFFIAVAGGLWLFADLLVGYLQLPAIPRPMIGRLPLPAALLGGGVLAGILVALASRAGVRVGARVKGARAARLLTSAVAKNAEELVVEPVNAELARYAAAKKAILAAKG